MSLHIEQRESEGVITLDLMGPSLWNMETQYYVTGWPCCISPAR